MDTLENTKRPSLRSHPHSQGRHFREPDPRGQIILEIMVIVMFWWGLYMLLDVLGRSQIDHFRRQPGLPTYERSQ